MLTSTPRQINPNLSAKAAGPSLLQVSPVAPVGFGHLLAL